MGQETAQNGLKLFDVGDAPVDHVRQNWVSNRGAEPWQDKVPHGSVEGDNGKETKANKGKGKGKADRHSRGKGEVVQQGAASDGPARAVVLGSALDTVANEVTSRAGTTSNSVCCFQHDYFALVDCQLEGSQAQSCKYSQSGCCANACVSAINNACCAVRKHARFQC